MVNVPKAQEQALQRSPRAIRWIAVRPGEVGTLLIVRQRRNEIRCQWLVPAPPGDRSKSFLPPRPMKARVDRQSTGGHQELFETILEGPLHITADSLQAHTEISTAKWGAWMGMMIAITAAGIGYGIAGPGILGAKTFTVAATAAAAGFVVAIWVIEKQEKQSSKPGGSSDTSTGTTSHGDRSDLPGGSLPDGGAGSKNDSINGQSKDPTEILNPSGEGGGSSPPSGGSSGVTGGLVSCDVVYQAEDGSTVVIGACSDSENNSSSDADQTGSSGTSSNNDSDQDKTSEDANEKPEPPPDEETPDPESQGGVRMKLTAAESLALIRTLIDSRPISDPQLDKEPVTLEDAAIPEDGFTDPVPDSQEVMKMTISRAAANALIAFYSKPTSDEPEDEMAGTTELDGVVGHGSEPVQPPDDPAAGPATYIAFAISGAGNKSLASGSLRFDAGGRMVGAVVTQKG